MNALSLGSESPSGIVTRVFGRSPHRFCPGRSRPIARVTLTAALLLVGTTGGAPAQTPDTTPAQTTTTTTVAPDAAAALTPSTYVGDALGFIERYAYRVPRVDWPAIRARAEAKAAVARTITDAYPVITEAVKALGDRHSSFTKPVDATVQTQGNFNGFGFLASMPSRVVVTVAPGGPATRAGLQVGDRIDRVNGQMPKTTGNALAIRNADGSPAETAVLKVVRRGVKRALTITLRRGTVTLVSVPVSQPPPRVVIPAELAYLDVPGIVGDAVAQRAFATQVQTIIRELDTGTRCGWIVDLRRNRGGYIYALLAGLGPLLGEGLVGGSRDSRGEVTTWTYRAGALYAGSESTVSVESPYVLRRPGAPVAVLTGGLTASAGEASVISFRTLPNARSFGEPTIGLTTFNVRKTLADGAFLDITAAVDVDRAGTPYEGPISPDEPVVIDWAAINNGNDAVVKAASSWLRSQPACTLP